MNGERTTPLRAVRPKESKTRATSTAAPMIGVNSPKRLASERRNLPPLPNGTDAGGRQEGQTHDRRDSVFSLEPLHPLQKEREYTSDTLLQKQCARISSGVKKSEGKKKVSEGAGMQRLHIRRSVPPPNSVRRQESSVGCGNTPTGTPTPSRTFASDVQAKFAHSIEVLNTMMKVESKNVDARAWVTRFVEGNSKAHLSKEHLFPVWILVSSNVVLAIDLNGTSKHRNYSWACASQFTTFPPHGCIIFPLQDVLLKGEVKLPQNIAEAAALQIPSSQELRWGVPLGLLFLNPHESVSIVRDVCQTYLPSFLQEVYADGVPLRGIWLPQETSKSRPGIIPLSKALCDTICSCMTAVGVGTFAGEGNRLQEGEPCGGQRPLRRDDLLPEKKEEKKNEEQKPERKQMDEVRGWCSPWESSGMQPIYTARLYTSGRVQVPLASTTVCRAVLVLTPRGPLELVVESPTVAVTVKDVKASLLRSGLGRSLRMQQDAVGFIYAPSTPVLKEGAVIDACYVVLRLQTQN